MFSLLFLLLRFIVPEELREMNSSDESLLSNTKIMTIAITAVNLVLSLPTNVWVVWLIARGAGGTLEAEFFPLSLAVFEILFCLLCIFKFLNIFFLSVDFWSAFAYGFLWSGRPVLQCCICMEQFLAVVHPVLFLKYKPLRYKALFSGLIWAVIIGGSVFYALSPTIKYFVFVGECLVVISVMLFCYFSVLVALKRPAPGEGKKRKDNNIKGRAFFTILVIVVSFIGSYLFWCAVVLSCLDSWFSFDRKLFIRICTSVTFASGFIQPLLYLRKTGHIYCYKAK